MSGKDKCRVLKEIRMEIARKNDIEYAADECEHVGECRGTCPKCEAELRYLEDQLARRKRLRKAVAVAGISIGVVAALSGCSAIDRLTDAFGGGGELAGVMPPPTPTEEALAGEIAPTPTPVSTDMLAGFVPPADIIGEAAPAATPGAAR